MAFASAPPPRPCVVPGGGLAPDGQRWVCCRPGLFLPVRVLSCLFRRLFLESLQKAFDAGKLQFFGALDSLREARGFARCIARAKNSEWVVYAKRPFAGPEHGLDSVGRYIHRVARSNNRLLDIENGQVRFPVEQISGQRPDPNDDFIGRRVHPAVLTGMCCRTVSNAFGTTGFLGNRYRFSGKSLPVTETCPVVAAYSACRCQTQTPLPRPSGTTATTTNASPVVRCGSVRNACAVTWQPSPSWQD